MSRLVAGGSVPPLHGRRCVADSTSSTSPASTALSSRALAGVIVFTLVAALTVLYVWRLPPFHSAVEMTEDAYVRGSVTVVAPKVDGYVTEVGVQDFDIVKQGQILVRLDDRNYVQKLEQARGALAGQVASLDNLIQTRRVREAGVSSALAQVAGATAQLENADAQLARARADMDRAQSLSASDSLSKRELDQTRAALHQAEASQHQAQAAVQVSQAAVAIAQQELSTVADTRRTLEGAVQSARAAVRLAEIDCENTHIFAPRDGEVGEVGVKLGQYVTPGTQLLAVVPPQVWVIANFKEAQTARMARGQTARMRVDALAGAELLGTVERISPATGSEFSAIKLDNATGNFTKIPQRLLVRIRLEPGQPLLARLRPGMSVVARVDTSEQAGAPLASR